MAATFTVGAGLGTSPPAATLQQFAAGGLPDAKGLIGFGTGTATVVARTNVAPSVPATTVAQANTLGYDVLVFIIGGTFTAATTIDTVAVTGAAGDVGMLYLPSASSIVMTYSSAPTWIWLAQQPASVVIGTIAFAETMEETPLIVLQPNNAATSNLEGYFSVTAVTASGFTLRYTGQPLPISQAAGTYSLAYGVIRTKNLG